MHECYMEQALALAREAAQAGEVPVGCVIVRAGAEVGRGRNRREEKRSAKRLDSLFLLIEQQEGIKQLSCC